MNYTAKQINTAIRKFRDYAQDVVNARHQTFGGFLSKFLNHCESDPVMKVICGHLESAAVMLESNDRKLTVLLDADQIQRVGEWRKRVMPPPDKGPDAEVLLEGAVRITLVQDMLTVRAEAVMPDRHLVSARNTVPLRSAEFADLQSRARELAQINNPALVARGEKPLVKRNPEFRQAAFEFGHKLYRDYLSGELAGVVPVLLHHRDHALLRLEVHETVEELPWEAMHDGEEFLALKVRLGRSLGSIQSAVRGENHRRPKGILLVGADSRGDLPGVESEVQSIGALLAGAGAVRVEVLTGAQASRQRVIELLSCGEFNVFHFSGHSFFDGAYPYQSYLELAQNTKLFLHELTYLAQPKAGGCTLNLVFLNSCQSGRVGQDETTGRNLSLCRVLREAGVDYVVGMAWNVVDDAAAQLGSEFYKRLMRGQQLNPAEAMRQTRRTVAMERSWSDGSWLAPVLYI